MKKLIISNSVLLFLLFNVFIFGYYFIEYPEDFNLPRILRNAEWGSFGLILLALIIGSTLLSFLPIKKTRFEKKVLVFLGGFQLLFLSVLLFKMGDTYWENKKHFEYLVSTYKKKAESDIRFGLIEIEYVGGLVLPLEQDQKMNEEIDSVMRTFGLTYRNSGCTFSASLIKAQDEYIRFTKSYLDKRNGRDWEVTMEKQIEQIRNNYR